MVNIVQFPNVRSVLSQGNTRLRLFHLLYDIEMMWRKTIKHAFSMFYPLIKHGFSTNQSSLSVLFILQTCLIQYKSHALLEDILRFNNPIFLFQGPSGRIGVSGRRGTDVSCSFFAENSSMQFSFFSNFLLYVFSIPVKVIQGLFVCFYYYWF